jgi:hypothetical protein
VVSKGLDLIKQLMDQNNMGGADAILKFLNSVVQDMPQGTAQAAEAQPFTQPQTSSDGGQDANTININVTLGSSNAQMVSHPTLPTVDGSAAGDQALTNAASQYVEGSDASKSRALTQGSNEWTAVMWAMQQNPNIRYNADTQQFFVQMSDGSKHDVCSLQDATNVINQNGGFNRGNPTGAAALGDFLKNKTQTEQSSGDVWSQINVMVQDMFNNTAAGGAGQSQNQNQVNMDELNSLLDELKKKLAHLQAAQNVMQAGATNITVTVAS